LAERAFAAVERWVYARGGRPRFKAMRRGIHSMSSKDGRGAIRLTGDGRHVQWGQGFVAPLVIDPTNPVHRHALTAIDGGRVLSVRIVRRKIRGRCYFDAQPSATANLYSGTRSLAVGSGWIWAHRRWRSCLTTGRGWNSSAPGWTRTRPRCGACNGSWTASTAGAHRSVSTGPGGTGAVV